MLPTSLRIVSVAAISAMALGACVSDEYDQVASESLGLAAPGRWAVPPDTLALGDTQYVDYTSAGPWIGEEGCGQGILAGAADLRDYLYEYFPQAYSIGGYSCRPIVGNSSQMSVHATGRALDIMIRTIEGEADNDLGDPIGNWLIENAEHIGIQYIIWDRTRWGAHRSPGDKEGEYTGQHPHHDHLHVEVSLDSADRNTPWHNEPKMPPIIPSCGTVPADGAIIDNGDDCSQVYGPQQYWRQVDGAGFGGSLAWTNAFENDTPSNWGRWSFDIERADDYRVDVYVVPEYAILDEVHYEIRHAGEIDRVTITPGATEGWVTLGDFYFDAGPHQDVRLFDNVDAAVADGQSIVYDALRITPADEVPDEPDVDDDGSGSDNGDLTGGCSTGGTPAQAGWLVALGLVAARRRRRR